MLYGRSGFPGAQWLKNPPANGGDTGNVDSIPRLGRSPGVRNGNPLQYSHLENPMDRGAWWAIQPMGSQRVRHSWSNLTHTYMYVKQYTKPLTLSPHLLFTKLPSQRYYYYTT